MISKPSGVEIICSNECRKALSFRSILHSHFCIPPAPYIWQAGWCRFNLPINALIAITGCRLAQRPSWTRGLHACGWAADKHYLGQGQSGHIRSLTLAHWHNIIKCALWNKNGFHWGNEAGYRTKDFYCSNIIHISKAVGGGSLGA